MKSSVLITGASAGIGAATAQLLSERGFEVFGTSRQPEALVADRPAIHWVPMDVCHEDSVQKGVDAVMSATKQGDAHAGLDGLVCNAGIGIFGSVEEVSIDAAKDQFETNFFGVLRTLRAVVPHMRAAGRGRIIIVGSLARLAPIPFQSHYSATKAALDALGMSLQNELHPYGVKVSLVEPGNINTGFNDNTVWSNLQDSPYAERIRSTEKVVLDDLPKAPGPELVARVVHRALTVRRPHLHYYVGPESFTLPWGRRLLPDRLTLKMIRSYFKI